METRSSKTPCHIRCSFEAVVLSQWPNQNFLTENFSPARRNSSQYVNVLYSLVFGYAGFLIYQTQNRSPNLTSPV